MKDLYGNKIECKESGICPCCDQQTEFYVYWKREFKHKKCEKCGATTFKYDETFKERTNLVTLFLSPQ